MFHQNLINIIREVFKILKKILVYFQDILEMLENLLIKIMENNLGELKKKDTDTEKAT